MRSDRREGGPILRIAYAVASFSCLLSSAACDPSGLIGGGLGVGRLGTALTQPSLESQPLPEAVRAKLNRVAITIDHSSPIRHQDSSEKNCTREEMKEDELRVESLGASRSEAPLAKSIALALRAALLALVSPGGGIHEVVEAHDHTSADIPAVALQRALVPERVDQFLLDHFVQTGLNIANPVFEILEETRTATKGGSVDYRFLQVKGIDAVLVFTQPAIEPAGNIWEFKVPFNLSVTFQAQLLRVEDNTVLYDRTLTCRGRQRKSTEWAQNNAEFFLQGVVGCYQILAETLVEEMFRLYVVPSKLAN